MLGLQQPVQPSMVSNPILFSVCYALDHKQKTGKEAYTVCSTPPSELGKETEEKPKSRTLLVILTPWYFKHVNLNFATIEYIFISSGLVYTDFGEFFCIYISFNSTQTLSNSLTLQ